MKINNHFLPHFYTVFCITNMRQAARRHKLEIENSMGVLTFGGMHPDFSDYRGELCRLKNAGIKNLCNRGVIVFVNTNVNPGVNQSD